MLRNQWYAIETSAAVGRRPIGRKRLGRPLVLWRAPDGAVRVAFDACPHRGAALSRGRLRDGCLECPYHGLRFDGDGACTAIPCLPDHTPEPGLHLHLLPVREERGLIWLWNGPARDDLPPLPWDDGIQAKLDAVGSPQLDITETFAVSYLRIMENLTDYHHVPFVHRTTIPVGAELTEFRAERRGTAIDTEGLLAGKLRASTHIRGPFFGLVRFDGAAFTVAVTPIDAENTWLFARYAQDLVKLPGLAWLATWALGQFDYRLLQRLQDLPVWKSQRLADPADIGRYQLLPVDEGVRLYFAMHDELAAPVEQAAT